MALIAPGKLASGSAPMDRAKTTARAEFCIPVSILTVRAVVSDRRNTFRGTKYPTPKPRICNNPTAVSSRGTKVLLENSKAEFSATTPPQIKEIKSTEPKGVKRLICFDRPGALD